jgi:hypothetical protein
VASLILNLGVRWYFQPLCTLGERSPIAHWMGGCVALRAKLGILEKRNTLPLPGFEPWIV